MSGASTWRALVCGTLVAATACAGGGGGAATPRAHGLPRDAGALDALARRFGRLRARMRARGGRSESGPWRTFVADGTGVSVPLDLPTDRCTTFVALGGGTVRDLRVALYDGDGEEVVSDEGHGEGGVVHVCPASPTVGVHVAPYYLVALAREGEGAMLVSSFTTEQRDPPDFAGLYDGLLTPRATSDVATARLTDARDALRAREFTPLAPPTVARLAEGDAVRTSVRLATEHCYTAVARAGDGVRDVDLLLFDPTGAEVARDLAEDAEPTVELCPETAGAYTIEARAFRGAGAVAVQVLSGPRASDGTPPTTPVAATVTSPADAVRAVVAPLVERHFGAPLLIVADGEISPGEVRTHDVPASGCLVVLGIPAGEATDLDLYVDAADGRELGRDTGVDSSAHVGTCLREAGVLRVTMKAYGRDGRYALAMLAAPPDVHDVESLRLDEATAPFRARGYVAGPARTLALSEGSPFRDTVEVPAGRCLAVAVAGSQDVSDVDVTLRDAAGTVVARDTRPAPEAAVSHCATENETVSVEVLAYRGAGTVLVVTLQGSS